MHLLGGIDEVGYGSRLGPLVLVAGVFEVADPSLDLWKSLDREVCQSPDGRRLPVCDSKELFSQRKGITTLEPTALGFLQQDPAWRGLTLTELVERLSGKETGGIPWLDEGDIPLPEVRTSPLRRELARAGVRLAGVRARFLEAAEFNDLIGRTGNKNRLHFEAVADLIEWALDAHPGRELTLRIGKLSGRNFYLRPLHERFAAPILVATESRGLSTYRLTEGGRTATLSFIRDGDRTEFPIALASIIAKYLRESWMRLFNAYWARRVSNLRPTAGYGSDALRFFEEIRPRLEPLEARQVFRSR
jgi:ribonuclease HII